jgi:hypothetical protein
MCTTRTPGPFSKHINGAATNLTLNDVHDAAHDLHDKVHNILTQLESRYPADPSHQDEAFTSLALLMCNLHMANLWADTMLAGLAANPTS